MKRWVLKYYFIFAFILLSLSNCSYAENFLVLKYAAYEGESLKNIVLTFFKPGTQLSEANNSLLVTMKKNPSITSWNPIKSDIIFKLYLDPKITDLPKYNSYSIRYKEKDIHHINIFSMPSIGFFSQSNNNGYTVKYNQISMLSLGLNYLYAPYKSVFNMSASFYYSTISSTSNQIVSGDNVTVDIPAEYGGNIYAIYKPDRNPLSFYSGLDIESFSSFNLENILNKSVVTIDTNNILYATAGLNYRPTNFEKYLFKFSVSKSVVSSYSSALSSNQKVNISGMKIITFLSYQINDKWSLSAMFKVHSFSGDNDLSIKRLGLGLGYSFF